MRLLIVGTLGGQLAVASRMAMERGATVVHADSIDTAMRSLRSGRGADLVMIDVLLPIAELIRRLYEAISSLTPTQARRVHARYMLGMKVKDIAAMEGITPSQAGKSIHAALRRLRRYFMRRKWTSGL